MSKEIIYNVTVKVAAPIAENWLQWLLGEHIPDVMSSACFNAYKVVRLLEQDESEGPTYAVQYTAPSWEAYQKYLTDFADEMRKRALNRWGDGFIAFRTVMEIVH